MSYSNSLSHLLFLGLLSVIQEKQSSGQEKHAPQDDDEGTEHEGIAQAEEPPQRWHGVALLKGVRDLLPRREDDLFTLISWHTLVEHTDPNPATRRSL